MMALTGLAQLGMRLKKFPLCHRRNCSTIVRTVETCREKVKAQAMPRFLLRVKEMELSVSREDVCVCVRKQQSHHSDASRNWVGEQLPAARSQNWPRACVRKHHCDQASRMRNNLRYSNSTFCLNVYSLCLCSGLYSETTSLWATKPFGAAFKPSNQLSSLYSSCLLCFYREAKQSSLIPSQGCPTSVCSVPGSTLASAPSRRRWKGCYQLQCGTCTPTGYGASFCYELV